MYLYLLKPLDNPRCKTKLVLANNEEHAREIADRHPHPLAGAENAVNYETMGDLFYANREHAACQQLTESKQYEVTGHEYDRYQVKLHLKFHDQRVVSLTMNEALNID